jgi:colanic acid biosynthesis glycosyl transferase WcaI
MGSVDSQPRSISGKRILLISMYYTPEHSGSAPYVADTAESLALQGAEVTVVTTWPHYPAWKRPPRVTNRWGSSKINGVKVHRVPTYVPTQPNLLGRAIYETSFLLAAAPVVARLNPDLVVGCMPALSSGVLATAVGRSRSVPVVQMVQDIFTAAADQAGIRGARHLKRLLSGVEGFALRSASRITVPAVGFLPTVNGLRVDRAKVVVVPNWSRVVTVDADRDRLREQRGWGKQIVVLHTGNMGMKQGLEDLAPSIRGMEITNPEIRFVFVGDGSQRQELVGALADVTNAEVLPPVPEEEYLSLLTAADILFVHERDTVKDMSLPSKLTSYFSAGRPVLAICHPEGVTAREVLRAGAGATIDHSQLSELPAVINELVEGQVEYGEAGLEFQRSMLDSTDRLEQLTVVLAEAAATKRSSTPRGPAQSV